MTIHPNTRKEVISVTENNNYARAWFVLFVLLLASVAAPLNQFKAPPVMPLLMDAFGLSVGTAGLLMSVFAITGVVLALPAGFISQKLGYRATGLLAIGSVAVGAALGALSASIGTILFSRIIEGVGTSLMAVVAPVVVAIWFAANRRGAPMGVWATWVPVGSTIMLVIAPLLAGGNAWQRVWWFGCIYAIVVGVLFLLFVRPAPQGMGIGKTPVPARPATSRDLSHTLRNRDLWLISFVFFCFNTAFIGFVTWAPTFLNSARGMSLSDAALLVSLVPMLNIGSCPFSGWFSDRIGSRKWVMVAPMLAMSVLWPLTALAREGVFLALVLVLGWISGFVPTGIFASGPELAGDERLSGMAIAILQVGMNAGMLFGPLALGWLIETGGWSVAFGALAPVCIAGAIAAWATRVK